MTKCKPYMRIMKVIRRTDTYIINFSSGSFKFIKMSVKPLKLNEKITFREITINSSDTIKFIKTGKKVVACFLNCMKMSDSYITCNTYYPEVFWRLCHTHAIKRFIKILKLSLIHISEPTRLGMISYAVFC